MTLDESLFNLSTNNEPPQCHFHLISNYVLVAFCGGNVGNGKYILNIFAITGQLKGKADFTFYPT